MDAGSEQPERIDDDASGGGVVLRRLLAVATLTPSQAALLVTDAMDQLELARSEGRYPIRFRVDAVTVSEDGRLTIECAGSGASCHEMSDAIAGLLRSITTNCRDSALADRLHESIAETTDLDGLVQRVRRAVAPDADPAEERRRRCQLAELVTVVRGRPLGDGRVVADGANLPGRPGVAAGSALAAHGWYPPARNAWHRRSRRPSRRRAALVLITVLVLIGALWSAPRAWTELRRGWDAVLNPVNPSGQNQISPVSPPPPEPAVVQDESATAGGTTAPKSVHVGVPGSAGPISQVTATLADGGCMPGQECTIRVDVHFDSAASVDTATWKLNVYDRCSGDVRTSTETSLPIPPGRHQVYGISRAALPDGTALAVAAVTSAPAVVASEPLLLPADNASC
ncbi:MAG: hypothetical protein WAW17_21565 [Rhodococcus sp. (in: high G+C Gram-positive bacteria)]|uniref:hypothetical protein n=1 Tax=Rhodococcus sp. TaxID=1831 RepID=UPI003BAEA0C0